MTGINKHALCSWSGGKDSCFALMKAIQSGFEPKVLLNVLNEEGKISRSHGIPAPILQRQAEMAGLPIQLISSSWEEYEKKFTAALAQLKTEHGLAYAVFGDIDLQPHRDWEEKVCNNADLTAVLPLWQLDRRTLVMEMLNSGIETTIVSCNATMGETFIGQTLTPQLIDQLEALGVDACGENGEFHTLVTNCPLFKNRLNINVGRRLEHNHYWFSELTLT